MIKVFMCAELLGWFCFEPVVYGFFFFFAMVELFPILLKNTLVLAYLAQPALGKLPGAPSHIHTLTARGRRRRAENTNTHKLVLLNWVAAALLPSIYKQSDHVHSMVSHYFYHYSSTVAMMQLFYYYCCHAATLLLLLLPCCNLFTAIT